MERKERGVCGERGKVRVVTERWAGEMERSRRGNA